MRGAEQQMLRYMQSLAREMLYKLDHTPDGDQKLDNELLPFARFENGLYTPNTKPPTTVYVEYHGDLWRFQRGKSRWQRA